MSFKSWSLAQDKNKKNELIDTPKVGPVIDVPTVSEEENPVIELPDLKS